MRYPHNPRGKQPIFTTVIHKTVAIKSSICNYGILQDGNNKMLIVVDKNGELIHLEWMRIIRNMVCNVKIQENTFC